MCRVLVFLLLFIVSCATYAANSRTICGQTVDETSYSGTSFPYWMDGNALIFGVDASGNAIILGELSPDESSRISILNPSGAYGSSLSSTSLFNSSGIWGSASSPLGVCNSSAISVPEIYWYVDGNLEFVDYLTTNPLFNPVDPATVVAALLKQSYLLGAATPTTPATPTAPVTVRPAPKIAAGIEYSFAIQSDASVLAWGTNDSGQLGNGQGAYSVSPVKVSGIGPLAAMAAGVQFSVALDQAGGIWTWGQNASYELADSTTRPRYVPRKIEGVQGTPTAVAAGNGFALALNDAGQVWAWGSVLGTSGQASLAPKMVAGLQDIRAIEAGALHALARDGNGQVWAWGTNNYGQIGNGTKTNSSVPVQITALSGITSISAGTYHNLALDSSGRVWAWGNNVFGTIGNGSLDERQVTTPVALGGLPKITRVFAGGDSSTAIDVDGGVWMWGTQAYGVNTLGVVRRVDELSAMGVVEVRDGWYFALARDGAGRVWAWGRNEHGYLGNGDTVYHKTAVQVPGLSGASSLSAQLHSLALTADGSLWAWGENGYGELGDGTAAIFNLPVSTSGLTSIDAIAAGGFHVLAKSSDGRVWGWGANNNYQLGDQGTVPRSTPAPIEGLANVVSVAAGTNHSLALDQSGQVWSWGALERGQLGQTGNRGRPSLVSGLPAVNAIAAGAVHSLAVGVDRTVWAWGANDSGQLGNGSRTDGSAPLQVANLSGIVSVAGGSDFSLALDSSGAVWAWGSNTFGQLGDGTAVDRLTPVKVTGLASATAIAAGGGHGAAVTSDGRLWTWGTNREGQLGRAAAPSGSSTAVALTDLQDIASVAAGWNHTVAQRTDGTVWSTGRNFSGALGEGTLAQRDSLTLVLNASGDGALDLDPGAANTVPASKLPPLLARASRVGDLSALSLTANLKPSLIGSSGFASSQGFAASGCGPCEVFVAALLGDGSLYLLDEQRNWAPPSAQQIASGTIAAFMRNAQLSSAAALELDILTNTNLTGLPATQILVGYGTNAQEMLAAGRYRSIFSVPTP